MFQPLITYVCCNNKSWPFDNFLDINIYTMNTFCKRRDVSFYNLISYLPKYTFNRYIYKLENLLTLTFKKKSKSHLCFYINLDFLQFHFDYNFILYLPKYTFNKYSYEILNLLH